jgi:hypothetical protein
MAPRSPARAVPATANGRGRGAAPAPPTRAYGRRYHIRPGTANRTRTIKQQLREGSYLCVVSLDSCGRMRIIPAYDVRAISITQRDGPHPCETPSVAVLKEARSFGQGRYKPPAIHRHSSDPKRNPTAAAIRPCLNRRQRQQVASLSLMMRPTIRSAGPVPFVVNLLGPPGAGKTSLSNALQMHDSRLIRPGRIGKLTLYYHLLKNASPMLLSFLDEYRGTRWFTRYEMLLLASITGRYGTLRQHQHDQVVFLIIDGPLYQLAYLQMFGPPFVQSHTFQRWQIKWHVVWSKAVALAIFLDAPDHVLFSRVNERKQDAPIKGRSFADATMYFARQRQLDRAATGGGSFRVIHIDSCKSSLVESVEYVLYAVETTLAGLRNRKRKLES